MSEATAAPTGKVFVLPITRQPALRANPRHLVMVSKPKAGKTTILAALDNCLTLDMQEGGDYVEIMSVKINTIADIMMVGRAILAQGRPYTCIGIDTGTDLEKLCIPKAEEIYAGTSMGQYWFYDRRGVAYNAKHPDDGKPSEALKTKYKTIINLPDGAGYQYLRQAFEAIYNYIKTWAPRTILSCHLKDAVLSEDGRVVKPGDIELTGKIKLIVASDSDGIGVLYRRGKQGILSFKTDDKISCGTRAPHLQDKEIVISEYDPAAGKVNVFWDRIYLPEAA